MSAVVSSAGPFTLGYGRLVDAVIGLRELQRHYEALPTGDFVDAVLDRFEIRADVRHLERVPAQGAAIVIANHPTGAMDGLLLLSALRRVRGDVRILGNHWLTRVPEMRERTIPLDVHATRPSQRLTALRSARRWLAGGGVLVIFPAGAVARRVEADTSIDEPWSPGVLALARWSGAPVVPVHLAARPSRSLRWAARLHPWLATALLPRELLRQRGRRVPVAVGQPIEASHIEGWPDATSRLAYLRARVSALGSGRRKATPGPPLAPQLLPSLIAREVASLPEEACLVRSGVFQVFCARAGAIPLTLREIGRLREEAFREVGEGTGAVEDLDDFDATYRHLFLWHRTRAEIVGAYRLSEVSRGQRLYTETLFRWKRPPGDVFGDALELGRSFVRPGYQRDPAALLLLWKGIGTFVAGRPHIRRLFGPVSVSAAYSATSRDLISRWLGPATTGDAPVASRRAVPRFREVGELLGAGVLPALSDLDRLVRELEGGQGLPVLLRQYLRLNGRVLAVSRDPAFADAMDALVVVDLLDMPATHLERYCGREGARRIRGYREGKDRFTVPLPPLETVLQARA
jgi:putative hemolysin